jgi:probable F420-dependent oxidoreductase
MAHPFRFGVQVGSLPADDWQGAARRIESLGFSTLFLPDHFSKQWDPMTAMSGVAAVTERLNVGSLVFDVDYRHPVVFAKAAGTLHVMSGGRHEFGIGAGWMETDYVEAGMRYDRPGVRISRLEEALQIIISMWGPGHTDFEGEHYTIREMAPAAEGMTQADRPKVLIGGGGRRVLSVAGRYADIVGINPALPEGRITGDSAADSTPERVLEKVGWVRAAAQKAGRNPDDIELNSLTFVVAITDDPAGVRAALGKGSGMTPEQISDCPLFLTGSASEIRDGLERRRAQTGISYIVVQGGDDALLERFAKEIVEPLSGR